MTKETIKFVDDSMSAIPVSPKRKSRCIKILDNMQETIILAKESLEKKITFFHFQYF